MSNSSALISGAAGRYATALFDLVSNDESTLDAVAGDLKSMGAMIGESDDLRRLISSPAFDRETQGRGVAALADKAGFNTLTRKFLGLMASKGRLFLLPDAIEGFQALLAEHRNEATAEVTTAVALSDEQRNALRERLGAQSGRTVTINETVDPSLIGGLIVRLGSKMIDASLRSKLTSLKLALKEA